MTAPSAQPRRFRLQVSLRMLLTLMAVVGIALVVYRWPWVEESSHEELVNLIESPHELGVALVGYRRRTTYRRNWRAQPVKSGLQQTWVEGVLWYEAHFAEGELNGPCRLYDSQGRMLVDTQYRSGKLHGKYREGDGQNWLWEGAYDRGELHGEWRTPCSLRVPFVWNPPWGVERRYDRDGNLKLLCELFPQRHNSVVMVSHWKQGQQHGLTTWQTHDGELLNTAEYHAGRFATWNGEPVVDEFRQWLTGPAVNEPQLAARLFSDAAWERFGTSLGGPVDDQPLLLFPRDEPGAPLVIHVQPLGERGPFYRDHVPSSPLGPYLCERAAIHGYGFQFRYGGLWLVPRADPEPPFVDPTGVDKIEFPPGSTQAREWDELIDVKAEPGDVFRCVPRLFAGTSLQLDLPFQTYLPPLDPLAPTLFRRSRRNAVGYVLYRTGYRCELHSGKLILLRKGRSTDERQMMHPLQVESYGL